MATVVVDAQQQQQPQGGAAAASTGGGPIYVDTQHDDMVHDAQLDYYGVKLATSSSDRTVKIYDVSGSTYAHTATLQGHTGPVWQVSWSHPKFGVVLASASFDGSVLFHRETRPGEWTLLHAARDLHESSVNSVAFAPHEFGLIAASASSDGRVSVLTHRDDDSWDVEYVKDNALGVNAVSWAPYAPTAASSTSEGGEENAEGTTSGSNPPPLRIVTGGCDNRVRFWTKSSSSESGSASASTWEEEPSPVSSSPSHSDWVRDVAWSPTVVPGVSTVASCSEDGTVLIWTQEDGIGSTWNAKLLHSFDAPVWRVSWSVTGNVLAVSSGDDDVTLWKAGLDGMWNRVSAVEDVASAAAASADGGAGGGNATSL